MNERNASITKYHNDLKEAQRIYTKTDLDNRVRNEEY